MTGLQLSPRAEPESSSVPGVFSPTVQPVHGLNATGKGLVAANVILPVLAIIVVALRLLSNSVKGAKLGSDDYTIIVSLVGSVAMCGIGIYGAVAHLHGVPDSSITLEEYTTWRKVNYIDILNIRHWL